ncbi:MAG TPA: glucose-1-phosphate adenylyltransferase [Dehalococcoidia bacterium]|nr:glucose-1-phosphate adenylyltransferase [Dehalococcoidia bacterium]
MNRVLAMILAGGASERLSILASERAKPAVPFGGKYRIIDFTLSNCVNSAIYNVAVLTQFNPRSLAQHIGVGRPWDLDRIAGGITLLQPFLSRSDRDWYRGTADAIYQNLYYVEEQRVDEVLILSGDHVYNMRYDHMISTHRSRESDVTVAVTEVPASEISRFGIIALDHNERVVNFQEKPKTAKSNLASMGIYVFDKSVLIDCLEEYGRKKGGLDFGYNILPSIIGKYKLHGYKFRGYWRDIGTIESYWQANMDLIADLPDLNLYDRTAEIRTAYKNKPPAKLGPNAQAVRSLLSNGTIINGQVENSVIFSGVFVEERAVVKDSVILDDSTVGREATVDRAIIDKQVWIGPGCYIGYGIDFTANKEEPENLNSGITVVGKGARIPGDMKVGRNCKIGCWVEDADFASKSVPSGESVASKKPRRHPL